MHSTADFAAVASLIANRPRAAMLDLMLDGQSHPSGDLAREAGVAPSTASGHLAALVESDLVAVEATGRQRRYRLGSHEVAEALEALAVIAPALRVSSLREATRADHLRAARTCYDHLAGRLGVAVTDGLVEQRVIRRRAGAFDLTRRGEHFLQDIGVDVDEARRRNRGFALGCPDWTEKRLHLAGALGAACCRRFLDLRWIERRPGGRAVSVTPQGTIQFHDLFGVEKGV